MILFVAAVAGFVIWKLRAGDRTAYAYYVILFSGDVQGLTNDSPVFYRGLRVGRVHNIQLTSRVDTQRATGRERLSEKIEVTVAVDWAIDIRERSYAVFEKPFIAGSPYIQIVGRLDVDEIKGLLAHEETFAVANFCVLQNQRVVNERLDLRDWLGAELQIAADAP